MPSGKIGSKINYTTADKIKAYEDQGYELVSNDFADGTQTYAKTGNDFVVHLKHKTQTITPNDPTPVTPGEPINPNDPNSPVYPTESRMPPKRSITLGPATRRQVTTLSRKKTPSRGR